MIDYQAEGIRDISPLQLVHENNPHDPGKVLVLDGNHRVGMSNFLSDIMHQVLAMICILSEENPDERTAEVQCQIRRGVRAIILHPHTPERVLTRLSVCT